MAQLMAAPENDSRRSDDARLRLWLLLLVDVVATSWMFTNQGWLEQDSWRSSVITIGGNVNWVLTLAVLASALLALMAITTKGFTVGSPIEDIFIWSAFVMSVIALSGLLLAILIVAAAGAVVAAFLVALIAH